MHSCITALSIVFLHFFVVEANYIFSIHIVDFSNPGNRLANGSCCSGTTEEGVCVNTCETTLRFCVRTTQHPQNDTDTCPALDFKGSATPRVSNPFVQGPWEGSAQMYIGVTESGTDQLIDNIFIELDLTANDPFTPIQNFTGLLNQATIELQFRILCAFDYFGMDCNTFCVGRNDTNAHYACGENGDILCIQGYQNESSNCTQCAPAEGCSSTNGFCNGPGECLCHDGWRGEHCDECIPTDGCSPTEGFCISPGECICQDGYSGDACDIEPVVPSSFTQSNIITVPSSLPAPPIASSLSQMFASRPSAVQRLSTLTPHSTPPTSGTGGVGSGLNDMFVAVGVGVGIGGILLILLILAAIMLAVVIIHRRKKKRGQYWFGYRDKNLSSQELIDMDNNSIYSGKSTPDCHIFGQALCNHPYTKKPTEKPSFQVNTELTKDGVPDLRDDFELAIVDSTMEKDKGQHSGDTVGGKEEKEKQNEKVLIKITSPSED